MNNIDGRTAFITGGASGIGLGIARALAKEGVSLALADIDEERLRNAKAEFETLAPVATFSLDVRDRDQFSRVADAAEKALGPVSLLFNNAGIASTTRIPELSFELWDLVLGIDLGGVVNGVQTFLPRFLSRESDGYIVNTASTAGLVVGPGVGYLYHTAKFGVVGLSEALRVELRPFGIGVSVLCPGAVATDIIDNSARLQEMAVGPIDFNDERTTRREIGKRILAQGTSPDDVGEMVLRAIKAQDLFIHTDPHAADAIRGRTNEILASVPTSA